MLTVNDPLLVEALRAYGTGEWPIPEREELRLFCHETLGKDQAFDTEVRVGRAADAIIAAAASLGASLLVIASHGLTGCAR